MHRDATESLECDYFVNLPGEIRDIILSYVNLASLFAWRCTSRANRDNVPPLCKRPRRCGDITCNAAKHGQLSLLEWCLEMPCVFDLPRLTTAAITGGQIAVLKWLQDRGANLGTGHMRLAAMHGQSDILLYLRELGIAWERDTASCAARAGHLETLKFLILNDCPLGGQISLNAVRSGEMDLVAYVATLITAWHPDCCITAVSQRRLDILRYIRDRGAPRGQLMCDTALFVHDLPILRYLCESGCPFTTDICYHAVRYDSLDALRYLHEFGAPWDTRVCVAAATSGYLGLLKYARENGCPWDVDEVMRGALANGHLDILLYAHTHGGRWLPWRCVEMGASECQTPGRTKKAQRKFMRLCKL